MPFGMVSGVGRGMGVLDGVVIVEGNGQFGVNLGRPIVTNGGLCDATLHKLLWAGLVFASAETLSRNDSEGYRKMLHRLAGYALLRQTRHVCFVD